MTRKDTLNNEDIFGPVMGPLKGDFLSTYSHKNRYTIYYQIHYRVIPMFHYFWKSDEGGRYSIPNQHLPLYIFFFTDEVLKSLPNTFINATIKIYIKSLLKKRIPDDTQSRWREVLIIETGSHGSLKNLDWYNAEWRSLTWNRVIYPHCQISNNKYISDPPIQENSISNSDLIFCAFFITPPPPLLIMAYITKSFHRQY